MITGLLFVLFGVLILLYPTLLVAMVAGLFMLFGLGMMATAWQFRRMKRESRSSFVNWIVRY
jgi:hypothetical protein